MKYPRILAIDSSGRTGSVALADGPRLKDEITFQANREQARDLIPIVNELVRRHGWTPDTIEHCYLSTGPGSFTGLRVGVTFARHLALAVGTRLCAVPTLDVIACNALDEPTSPSVIAVLLDAKGGRVFGGTFERIDSAYVRKTGPHLIEPPALFESEPRPEVVLGEGVSFHEDAIRKAGLRVLDQALWWPRAKYVHQIGYAMAMADKFTPAEELTPLYIRRPDAEVIWERREAAKAKQP